MVINGQWENHVSATLTTRYGLFPLKKKNKMATYKHFTLVNTATKETKKVLASYEELEELLATEEYADWEVDRPNNFGTAPGILWGGTGTLGKLDDGFNDRLKEIKKYAGKTGTVETK